MKGTISGRKAAYLSAARPDTSNPFNEILTNTETKINTHRRQTLVKLVEEFDKASDGDPHGECRLSEEEEEAIQNEHEINCDVANIDEKFVDEREDLKSKAESALNSKVTELVQQLKLLIGEFDDGPIFTQVTKSASLAAANGLLGELLSKIDNAESAAATRPRRSSTKVRFSEGALESGTGGHKDYRTANSPHMVQKQPFSNHTDDDDGITTLTSVTATTISTEINAPTNESTSVKGTVAALRRSRDLDQLAERLSNVPALAHTLPVLPGPGGINSLPRSCGSRYSVGMNRFSTTAKKLSMDTLNYVNGSRFLTTSMRLPSTALMSNIDARFLSPSGKQPSLAGTPAPAIAGTPGSGISSYGSANTFAEFCVVGISEEVLSGRQPLERQCLQSTGISYRYPSIAEPTVANLHEYCFPYGAKLHYVNKKGLEKAFNDVNTLQYQILQFTDANSKVHYATCIITLQPLDNVSEQLRLNLEELQLLSFASDTIKRYYRHYQYKKKSKFKKCINDAWAQNISKSRNTSLDSAFSSENSAVAAINASMAASKAAKSASKSLFKVLNPFRSKKHHSQKGQKGSTKDTVHHNHHHWLSLGKPKPSFSSQSTDLSDEGKTQQVHMHSDVGQHHNAALLLAVHSSDDLRSNADSTTLSSQQGGPSPLNKRYAVNARASLRFDRSLLRSPIEGSGRNSVDAATNKQQERSYSDGDETPSAKYSDKLELTRNPSSPALMEGSRKTNSRQSLRLVARSLLHQRSQSFGDKGDDASSLPSVNLADHILEDDISSVGSERDLLSAFRTVGAGQSHKTGMSSITQSDRLSSTVGDYPSPLREALNNSAKIAVITERAYCFISDKPLHPVFFQVLEVIVQKERQRALDRCAMIMHSSFFSRNKNITQSPTAAVRAAAVNDERQFQKAVPVTPPAKSALGATGSHLVSDKENKPVPSLFRTYSEMHSFYTDRETFLQHIRNFDLSFLLLPPHQRRRTLSCDSSGSIRDGNNRKREIDLSLKAYVKHFSVSTRMLSLKEWTSALLFSLIPSELVVKILSLLLQEQSLLVFGSHSGLVTALTTAFAQLLDPFVWEGIFVPLLPTAAYEALDAPVPYIIGIASSTRPAASMIASTAGVLHLDDFVNHGEQYVPTCFDDSAIRVTITSMDQQRRSSAEQEADRLGSLRFFDSPCAVTDDAVDSSSERTILMEPSQCSQLKELNQLVAYHAGKISESTRQFSRLRMRRHSVTTMMKGVMFHMSSESLRSLRTVLKRIHEHNSSLCGEVLTQPGGYKKFGVVNSQTGWFEFLPELFMEPLKTRLKFQESVINTQLFVSFMDQQRVDYEACANARRFIGEWIYFRVVLLKKRSRRRRSSLTS